MRRLITPVLFLAACAHNPTPGSRNCTVLDAETQLDACTGKTVTLRGRVAAGSTILGVPVAAGPELVGQPAHAIGKLDKSGPGFTLTDDGKPAQAHAVH
jgi:hypothetical protein